MIASVWRAEAGGSVFTTTPTAGSTAVKYLFVKHAQKITKSTSMKDYTFKHLGDILHFVQEYVEKGTQHITQQNPIWNAVDERMVGMKSRQWIVGNLASLRQVVEEAVGWQPPQAGCEHFPIYLVLLYFTRLLLRIGVRGWPVMSAADSLVRVWRYSQVGLTRCFQRTKTNGYVAVSPAHPELWVWNTSAFLNIQ